MSKLSLVNEGPNASFFNADFHIGSVKRTLHSIYIFLTAWWAVWLSDVKK